MKRKDDVGESPVFKELSDIFEKIFRAKGFVLEDYFNSDVFFLTDDVEFHTLININNTTPTAGQNDEKMMYKILKSISENGFEFRKLKVKVRNFIKSLADCLIELQSQKEMIDDKISLFQIDETINIIEQKLYNLQKPDGQLDNKQSTFKISISRLDQFPEGEYSFKLFYSMFKNKPSNLLETEDQVIVLPSVIKKDKNTIDFKDKAKEFTFQTINIYPLSVNYSNYKDNDNFVKIFSGSNLIELYIEITEKNGTVYKTNKQEFLDIYLKLISTFFTDLTKNTHEINLKLKAYKQETNKAENSQVDNTTNEIVCSFNIDINRLLRTAVLERIHHIYKDTISFRRYVESNLSSLLGYFPNQKETIRYILSKSESQEHTPCTDCGCLVI